MMERGYNGFSFRDVAADVGIKSASIHYHYPTKADLAQAAARDYREAFAKVLEELDAPTAPELLRAYGDLFVQTLKQGKKACLGGVLAVDATTLPPQVLSEIKIFFDDQQKWVSDVLRHGQATGEVRPELDPDAFASLFVSGLEGAMLVARGIEAPEQLSRSLDQLVLVAST